jgi:hypothetical protein
MTTRERWMLTGLVAALFGLAALGIWNQARYGDLREAVNKYVALDERQEKETPETAALLRQARPEIRRSLARGEFEVALKRLKSLEAEDADTTTVQAGKAIPIAQLWPANSPERKKLQTALQDLVRKQAEGYDVTPAQQKLVEVAEAARAGKRAEALAAFEQAAVLIQGAPLRPGFKPKVILAAGPTITPAEMQLVDQSMQKLRGFRDAFPQVMAQPGVTDRQKQVLGNAKVLFDEMIAAYDAKRDMRSMMKRMDPLKKAFDKAGKSQEWGPVETLIQDARKEVKDLPPLPPLAGAPGQPPVPGAPGAPPAPVVPPPVLPPAAPPGQPTPGQPAPPNAETIVRFLDVIRALPEAKYQAEKPKIGAGILQMLAGAQPAAAVPDDAVGGDLQLLLGPQGELRGLRLFGETLALAPKDPGGVSVQFGEGQELPIRAPVSRQGDTRQFKVESPAGAVTVLVTPSPGALTLKVAGKRTQGGVPAFLNLTLPLQLGGWTWQPGTEAQTIAVDHDYHLQPVAGKLPALLVRGAALDLTLDAPTAAEVTYLRGEGRLRVRLPLTSEAGVAEHTLRLAGVRRAAEKAQRAAPSEPRLSRSGRY